jgi:hypothetical protein
MDEESRKARHDAIAAYAAEMAATEFDLDLQLEAAGIESLMGPIRPREAASFPGPSV